jgi:spermidine synthase
MRLLGRYQGKFGTIDVIERKSDGARLYVEEGIYQSQAMPRGELPFQYVRLMAGLLAQSTNVLLLGCGGGTLATLLVRAGKAVTVVDHNPISFKIAQGFFAMPSAVTCVCSDFRDYLRQTTLTFDGIGIDVSGPGFDAADCFDPSVCELIRSRLHPRGRMTMNLAVASDVDPLPDRIAGRLASGSLHAWIFDHPGVGERNAIIACRPERSFNERKFLVVAEGPDDEEWSCRRARIAPTSVVGRSSLTT